MEQMYIAYVLGIATVILIGMVIGVVRANIMVSKHNKRFDDVYSNMHSLHESSEKHIQDFQRDVFEHVEPELHKRIDENRSYIDSRFDKFETKLKSEKVL